MRTRPVQICDDVPVEMGWAEVSSASDPDTEYTVVITDPAVPKEWVCECEGYQFRGSCSHQQRAFDAYCRWDQDEGPENQTKEQEEQRICPRCGGPTTRIWRRIA